MTHSNEQLMSTLEELAHASQHLKEITGMLETHKKLVDSDVVTDDLVKSIEDIITDIDKYVFAKYNEVMKEEHERNNG